MSIKQDTPATHEGGHDPRLSELISTSAAARLAGLSYWQVRYAVARGELRSVTLPNGGRGIYTTDVVRYASTKKKARQESRARLDIGSLAPVAPEREV